ncbi:MAG TPA: hypothetical protein ENO17_10340 [Candidatus Atribacteria bacterium]|nr:hypothetical protein [Candidatus Atribacteria bacterium]
MSKDLKIRWGLLKGMYIYTIISVGLLGLGMIIMPEKIKSLLSWPVDEPIAFGIMGSVYLAFGLLSILGIRSPLKFVSVLLLQLFYKLILFIGVLLPLFFTNKFPSFAIPMSIIFATYIIGDFIAIPFSYIFTKESNQ